MTPFRRTLLGLGSFLLVAPVLLAGVSSGATTGQPRRLRTPPRTTTKASEAAVAWQRIAIRTICSETAPTPAPPAGCHVPRLHLPRGVRGSDATPSGAAGSRPRSPSRPLPTTSCTSTSLPRGPTSTPTWPP